MKIPEPITLVTGASRGGTTLLASFFSATGQYEVKFQEEDPLFEAALGNPGELYRQIKAADDKFLVHQVPISGLVCGDYWEKISTWKFLNSFENLKVAVVIRSGMDSVTSRWWRSMDYTDDMMSQVIYQYLLLWPFMELVKEAEVDLHVVSFKKLIFKHRTVLKDLFDWAGRGWIDIDTSPKALDRYYDQAPSLNYGGSKGGRNEYIREYQGNVEKERVFNTWMKIDQKDPAKRKSLEKALKWMEDLDVIRGK